MDEFGFEMPAANNRHLGVGCAHRRRVVIGVGKVTDRTRWHGALLFARHLRAYHRYVCDRIVTVGTTHCRGAFNLCNPRPPTPVLVIIRRTVATSDARHKNTRVYTYSPGTLRVAIELPMAAVSRLLRSVAAGDSPNAAR